MKKILIITLMLVLCCSARATTNLSALTGVWSADNAEAVITDSICIFYCQKDSVMKAFLEIPTAGISSKTIFMQDGSVITTSDNAPLEITNTSSGITISGIPLKKVEDINPVKPYELPQCNSKFDVGKCLQIWRLGAGYGKSEEMIYCEVNTNRHMFVYMVSPSMTYIRAAATRNNNLGTLFFQNIRMMKNNNTNEFTMYFQPNNYTFTLNDLYIDNTKFQPNSCTFDTNGGIYWSVISSEPNLILLNGCGETYQVKRHEIESDMEYFEYVPYSDDIVL
jgi:hypothetical protein